MPLFDVNNSAEVLSLESHPKVPPRLSRRGVNKERSRADVRKSVLRGDAGEDREIYRSAAHISVDQMGKHPQACSHASVIAGFEDGRDHSPLPVAQESSLTVPMAVSHNSQQPLTDCSFDSSPRAMRMCMFTFPPPAVSVKSWTIMPHGPSNRAEHLSPKRERSPWKHLRASASLPKTERMLRHLADGLSGAEPRDSMPLFATECSGSRNDGCNRNPSPPSDLHLEPDHLCLQGHARHVHCAETRAQSGGEEACDRGKCGSRSNGMMGRGREQRTRAKRWRRRESLRGTKVEGRFRTFTFVQDKLMASIARVVDGDDAQEGFVFARSVKSLQESSPIGSDRGAQKPEGSILDCASDGCSICPYSSSPEEEELLPNRGNAPLASGRRVRRRRSMLTFHQLAFNRETLKPFDQAVFTMCPAEGGASNTTDLDGKSIDRNICSDDRDGGHGPINDSFDNGLWRRYAPGAAVAPDLDSNVSLRLGTPEGRVAASLFSELGRGEEEGLEAAAMLLELQRDGH